LLASNDDGEWRKTQDLQVGDEIKLANGAWAKVLEVRFKGKGQVYNFTVAGNHNYFVGDLQLLTHNACPGTNAQFGKKYGEHMKDYPGMNHKDYRALADSMYDNPSLQRYAYPSNSLRFAGETHIVEGNNLLRLDPAGNFRSLYPGVPSTYWNGFPTTVTGGIP
jgi:hypothetical protein